MSANLENSAVATGLGKVNFHSNPKERQWQRMFDYHTIALISHDSKVILKLLQARLQQYVNQELSDVQAGFRKGRGTRDQVANTHCIIEKAKEFQKNIYFCFIDYTKAFYCVDHNKLWKILRDGNTRPPDLPLEIKKQQLELDTEQWAGSKLGKECIKAVYISLCLFNFYRE